MELSRKEWEVVRDALWYYAAARGTMPDYRQSVPLEYAYADETARDLYYRLTSEPAL